MVTLQFPYFLNQSATSLYQHFNPNATEVNGKVDVDFSELQLSSELLKAAKFQSSWISKTHDNDG